MNFNVSKNYYYFKKITFSNEEILSLIITIMVVGFILGVDDGRNTNTIDYFWLKNFVASFIASGVVFLIFVYFVKYIGYFFGYDAKYKYNLIALVIGVFLSFISYGKLVFFLPGWFDFIPIEHRRLGKLRYGPMLKDKAKIVIFTLTFIIILAIILKKFNENNPILQNTFNLLLLLSLYSILPIPPKSAGLDLFIFSRRLFLFVSFTILFLVTMLFFLSPTFSILFSLIFGYLAYYKLKDKV